MALESESKKKKVSEGVYMYIDKFYTTHKLSVSMEENVQSISSNAPFTPTKHV